MNRRVPPALRRNSTIGFRFIATVWFVSTAGCNGSTGGDLLAFRAYGAGPSDAVAGQPYSFASGRGFQITLDRAHLHVGALYLNRSRPTSVSSDTSCTLAGIYVAEVPGALDLDVLDPRPQPFATKGFATSDFAPTGEVWLSGGDINAGQDTTVVLDIAGTASKNGFDYPFTAALTIGQNRAVAPADSALPGAHPICKQRVVSPIPTDITPERGGSLVLRVDPRGWFANVDFSKLDDDGGTYTFHDASDDQPSANLFLGLRASQGTYRFDWETDL